MARCPYCGRWFKNKQAVRAHLKHCPLKKGLAQPKRFSNKIEVREFDFMGCHWFIKGKKGFMDILSKINNELKGKGHNVEARRARLIGVLYALYELGIIIEFSVKPIKQIKQKP
jgi:hypothetical protein